MKENFEMFASSALDPNPLQANFLSKSCITTMQRQAAVSGGDGAAAVEQEKTQRVVFCLSTVLLDGETKVERVPADRVAAEWTGHLSIYRYVALPEHWQNIVCANLQSFFCASSSAGQQQQPSHHHGTAARGAPQ